MLLGKGKWKNQMRKELMELMGEENQTRGEQIWKRLWKVIYSAP